MKTFFLVHAQARERCAAYAMSAPEGWVVRFGEPVRNLEQNARMHAMIGEIAKQWRFCERKWDAEDMKRLCLDQFRRDTIKDPDLAEEWANVGQIEMAPSIDKSGVVALGFQSRRLTKKLGSAFIEWLYALGAEVGVTWGAA